MNIAITLFKNFVHKQKNHSVSEQKHIIDSMPEPNDDFDRAYFNYLCNSKGQNATVTGLFDLLCNIAIPLFLFVYLKNRIVMWWDKKHKGFEHHDALIILAGNRSGKTYSYDGIYPHEIWQIYKDVKIFKLDVFPKYFEGVFSMNAFGVWFCFVKKHPLKGFINLRCLENLMGFNHLLLKYSPKAIVISRAEFNNMSSVISLFCETNGIEFINFMHGEALPNIQHAFVRFSKFYIWDEHYIKIFTWERCPVDQFVVYTPEIYSVAVKECPKPIYYLTYIFTGDERTGKDANAEEVKNILIKLVDCGLKCKVRAHPRWSDFAYLTEVFMNTNIDVEDPKKVNGKDSILLSKKIAGTYSTMLSEAYHMDKDVVIDDITNPSLINELQEKMYIMLNKNHELLSEIVQKLDKIETTNN